MKASELRIGNYHLYCVHDELDNPKDYEVVDQIDAQDLVWLSSEAGENDTQYKPIPLTEDWLKRFGFALFAWGWVKKSENDIGFRISYPHLHFQRENENPLKIQYVHQLQNLYFALTGEDLKLREE